MSDEKETEAGKGLSGIVRRVTGKETEPIGRKFDYASSEEAPLIPPEREPVAETSNEPAAEAATEPAPTGPGGKDGGGPGGPGGQRRPRGPRRERDSTPPPPPAVHVPIPSKRGPLSEDLERELEEALGGKSLEEVIAEPKKPAAAEGEGRQRGQVVKIHGDNVFFTLGGRNEGVASLRSFKTPPNVGDVVDVVVTGRSREDGLYDVNIPGASIAANTADWSELRQGSIVEARISGANVGGLECAVGSVRGFIPASQISLYRTENLGDFIGQKLVCVVTEANERRGNLVLSRRAILEREKEEAKKQLLAELAPGQSRDGVVRKLMDFGAFVDLGGVDGLIHIGQLSWDRIKHPSEVLTEGQKVRVKIEKMDPETGKISLSYRSEADHPWKDIDRKFPVGATVEGVVSRIADFGAFVKLAMGVEGLIHVSELSHSRVYAVKNIVKEGQTVSVKVLSVDPESQRMSLSLKATLAAPVKAEKKEEEVADEPPRKPVIPKRNAPLKGGTSRSSGGEQFGLKW